MKILRILACSAFAVVTLASFAAAGSHDKEKKMGDKPAMSADEQKMMEMWMKASTPGPEHSALMARAGNWDATVTSWMAPGAPPETSAAKAERKPALGGRVLEEHWSGTMMGAPFEGRGWNGYDNVSKKHWGVWIDNMGTGIMRSEGSCDMVKKACTFSSTYNDPMTGKEGKSRMVTTWATMDDEKMEMFMLGPDGKEFKGMEIVSKRAKAAM